MRRRSLTPDVPKAPDLFADVAEFNVKFGLPTISDGPPILLDEATLKYRENFMQEELHEFGDAMRAGELAKALDALNDLVYIALGTAHFARLPFNEGWREVQRANMKKVKGPHRVEKPRTAGLPGVEGAFEVHKPEGWREPDQERVLREHVYIHHDKSAP